MEYNLNQQSTIYMFSENQTSVKSMKKYFETLYRHLCLNFQKPNLFLVKLGKESHNIVSSYQSK